MTLYDVAFHENQIDQYEAAGKLRSDPFNVNDLIFNLYTESRLSSGNSMRARKAMKEAANLIEQLLAATS